MFIGALAPIKDRVKGSKVNKPGSASGSGRITFSDSTTKAIKTVIRNSPVSLSTGKAVIRRGFGAYSSSHRPGISRFAWGLARLKQFVRKAKGLPVNRRYVQDDDLLRV
jgi:Family of unknown function (DUF5824)